MKTYQYQVELYRSETVNESQTVVLTVSQPLTAEEIAARAIATAAEGDWDIDSVVKSEPSVIEVEDNEWEEDGQGDQPYSG